VVGSLLLMLACRGADPDPSAAHHTTPKASDSDSGSVIDTEPGTSLATSTAGTSETGLVAGGTGSSGATADTGMGSTGDTGPPLSDTLWVLGTDAGDDRACVVSLDAATLAHHAVYCVPDGEDYLPAEVWRWSPIRDVDGHRLLALVLRLELLGIAYGFDSDTITGYEVLVVDLDDEVAVPLWRFQGEGTGGVAVHGVVVEGPAEAVVHTVSVGSFQHDLARLGLTGLAPVPVPSGSLLLGPSLGDDALLLTSDGLLGRVDATDTWSPISAVGASAFYTALLADGRAVFYENVDVAGHETGQLAVASLGGLPTVDARTLAAWGDDRSVQRLLPLPDGTVLVVSDDEVQHWDASDGATPGFRFDLSTASSVSVAPSGDFVAERDGHLHYVGPTTEVQTDCADGGLRYDATAYTPSGRWVIGSLYEDGEPFQALQRCDEAGQPTDLTASTGLRGLVLGG